MAFIAKSEFMVQSLTRLLKNNETLQYPFYGAIEQIGKQKQPFFFFFGLTGNDLLVAILNPFDAGKIDWTSRVPLDMRGCVIKKSMIPKLYKVHIIFNEGNDLKLRVSKKLLVKDFYNQEENVDAFFNYISALSKTY